MAYQTEPCLLRGGPRDGDIVQIKSVDDAMLVGTGEDGQYVVDPVRLPAGNGPTFIANWKPT
jgi:hypothetical protein